MHRVFISTVIAAALTMSGISATMAQAGEYRYAPQARKSNGVDPIAATIAGFAALAIIGAAIENNNRGSVKKEVIITKQPPAKKRYVAPKRHYSQKHAHRNHRAQQQRAHRNAHRHGHRNAHRHTHRP